MGRVYRASDLRLGRPAEIKVSRTGFTSRFRREARAVAALNHPHICTLYDLGPNYLVMEYIDGAPIQKPMPLADAIQITIAIAGALDAAHSKGIIHRDLKPANILLTDSGPKPLDFGLVKLEANCTTGIPETTRRLPASRQCAASRAPHQGRARLLGAAPPHRSRWYRCTRRTSFRERYGRRFITPPVFAPCGTRRGACARSICR